MHRGNSRYQVFIDRAVSEGSKLVCAVAHPCDDVSLASAAAAKEQGIFEPILVGPRIRLAKAAKGLGLDLDQFQVRDTPHSHASADLAVDLVKSGQAALLMKGSLHTDELMHAVLGAQSGLRTNRKLSHVFMMDVPGHAELLFITDAAINIFPDLETKADIVRNAIELHHALGLGKPKVAILAAVEQINPRMPSTIDAAALCKMADRGQIEGGVIDGPLALDNAISPDAARIKGIHSKVAGYAQILVVPDLEAGNMLAKNLTFLSGALAAGVVVGARVPIILTSRADSEQTRLASCAVAVCYARWLSGRKLPAT
ncbi:phosphate acetyltransferase [Pusillimonas sp. DMV24BSW_D]|uniref:phosphate acetyltransferase n=1 Tax=Neopusillimonas aestuarii TaxID=2716226 RepID=UPI00140DA623|nr:phosphate acetyltransferase [Pusillimonas sp. DMV24BSW_D]QIM49189.1 phosphate acetyltransferase [Pusillimonas sp. DMV24BSW_D]